MSEALPSSHPTAAANVPEAFGRVAIVGVGLLGASLGLALKQAGLAKRVVGVGRPGSLSLPVALERGAVDETTSVPAAGVAGSDLVVLCTPVRQFPDMFAAMAPALGAGAVVTDVGSTKQEVLRWAEEILPKARFVGSHPMAGSEKSGPEFASADLYKFALTLICVGPQADAARRKGVHEAARRVEGMWQAIGSRTLRLDPEVHDQWVATVSHLPHAAATALLHTAARHPEALEAAAGGFLDTTRIASGDTAMWTDIFLTNRKAVQAVLGHFIQDLTALRNALKAEDEAAVRAHLEKAKGLRDALLKARAKKP